MRIILFSGKGGVGKTSLAAATGLRLAESGRRTLIMSVDPAHSLADVFDLGVGGLFHSATSDPFTVTPNLDIQEVNIQREIKRHWKEISAYMTTVLRSSGLNDVEAEEMAILPGMEELSAMMYVNQYRRGSRYDAVILDCAPTAESLRFISMPTTFDWYMRHIFPIQRGVLKAIRPVANRLSPVELPSDSYFSNIRDLYEKIEGIDGLLEDPQLTSVRLVTNAEKMVVRETERAFVYFSLYGLTVDQVIVNRLLPESIQDAFFVDLRASQQRSLEEIAAYFDPVPICRVPLFPQEVLGIERLRRLGALLYPEGADPAAVTRTTRPYQFVKTGNGHEVHLLLPFAAKGEIGLFKKGDELVVEVGTLRRHIGLPTSMSALKPVRARLENNILVVELQEEAA
ncbi:MAG: TRC40/GET3/ArsA family transport-energizing ATPase [Bryobacteraceae bacterium]